MDSSLRIEIENLRSIKSFNFDFPIKKGISVITGENGSGKSTIMSVLATLFSKFRINDFTEIDINSDTAIKISFKDRSVEYKTKEKKLYKSKDEKLPISGFYEGSIIHGTRFRDTTLTALKAADNVNPDYLVPADDFVLSNFGYILHNNKNYYNEIFRIKKREIARDLMFLENVPYFFKHNGHHINQYHMSTGECLLMSLLHLINNTVIRRRKEFINATPYLVLIDEIELALHPSAINRLITFLEELTTRQNVAILFSSHSIEVIRRIASPNIYYLVNNNGAITTENPCYPAYVTKDLYITDGFDFLILVEDELAKYVIERIINENKLYNNRLIQVLPCGGWNQVLRMHIDIIKSKLAGPNVQILTILDGDVKEDVKGYSKSNAEYNDLPKNFLPIKSIEKYLLSNLVTDVNYAFKKEFFDKFVRLTSASETISQYQERHPRDSDGKLLLKFLINKTVDEGSVESQMRRQFCEFIFDHTDFEPLVKFITRMLAFK